MAPISTPGRSSNNFSEREIKVALQGLPLSNLRFFASIGSTNDEALVWAAEGAHDLALVVADEQTSGRGRMGRRWHTPPGSALAFSLILRPKTSEREHIARFSGLGALALLEALKKHAVSAQIKWPNDVLIDRRKVAGILVESVWMGADVDSVVLGMGVNVAPDSVPPAEELNFPATCVQSEGPVALPRLDLLKDLLTALLTWRPRLGTDQFMESWENALAFRGETVQLWTGATEHLVGQLEGLERDGSLRVGLVGGEKRVIRFGEVHLRPV